MVWEQDRGQLTTPPRNIKERIVPVLQVKNVILDKHPVSVKSVNMAYPSIMFVEGPPTPINNLVRVEEGKTAFLECNASQYSPLQTAITFQWFRKGVLIPNPSNSSEHPLGNGKYKGTLTLTSVTRADANSYTCKANGTYGLSNSSETIQLDVTCKLVFRCLYSVRDVFSLQMLHLTLK